MKKTAKLIFIIFGALVFLFALLLGFYIKGLPFLVSNASVINFVEKQVNKSLGANISIVNPSLQTSFSPHIVFKLEALQIEKNSVELADVKNFQIDLSFKPILQKKIILNKLGAEYIYANVDELSKLSTGEDKKDKKESNFKVDMFHSLLYVKEAIIIYNLPESDVGLKINAKNLEITDTRNPKYVKFDVVTNLTKGNKTFTFKFNDNNSVYFQDRTLFAKDFDFFVNNSKVRLNFELKEKGAYKLNIVSDKFDLYALTELTRTNLFLENGDEILAILKDVNGNFKFNIDMNNDGMSGSVLLNRANFKVTIFNDLPITLTKGNLAIKTKDVDVNDFEGYYGKNVANDLKFKGIIKDYMKTFDTEIKGLMTGTKELTTDYITPMAGYPIELLQPVKAGIKFKMLGNKMDISTVFKLKKGNDILLDKVSVTPADMERGFWAQMELEGNNFALKNLNYYIADKISRGNKIDPILQVYGNFDVARNMAIKDIGFKIVKPLASEFLNLFFGDRIFRRGQIYGNLDFIDDGVVPYLKGNLSMDKVMIPSQRMSFNELRLAADKGLINLNVNGIIRRNSYEFNGQLLNEMRFPFIIKGMDLHLAELNIEKVLESMNRQQQYEAEQKAKLVQTLSATENESADDEAETEMVFVRDLVVVEKSNLKIDKGSYKLINFGNVNAHMTLDKDGLLKFWSNKFDIAEGTAAADIKCDLFNQKYNMTLDVNEVDSDIITTSILQLPREITGPATGKIELNADSSLKINGKMTFNIKEGSIAKIGLVKYVLNFVSLFRNPLAMISPVTILDLVNVPDGYFDEIKGVVNIKENNIKGMMIKSTSPQLSTFIIGSYNIEKADAMLRIYTKFSNENKGVAGLLRNISLNALAAKVPMSSKNDASYYEEELRMIPPLAVGEKDSQVFLTRIDGDVEHNNFISSVKRIK
ncbi:MAG: AsmA-like C-terminal region-containing protein [bacterium]|nr:AsmA-like C-terminal region-containing protein [bacterium]